MNCSRTTGEAINLEGYRLQKHMMQKLLTWLGFEHTTSLMRVAHITVNIAESVLYIKQNYKTAQFFFSTQSGKPSNNPTFKIEIK